MIPGFIKMYSHKLKAFIFTTSTYSIYFLIFDEKFKWVTYQNFCFVSEKYIVLEAFNVCLFALNQSAIFESSKFTKSFILARFSEEYCNVVSSAKSMINSFDAFGRSFMRIKNKIGPNNDPWGTPQSTSSIEEFKPLIEVNCFLHFHPNLSSQPLISNFHPNLSSQPFIPIFHPNLSSQPFIPTCIPTFYPNLSSQPFIPTFHPNLSSQPFIPTFIPTLNPNLSSQNFITTFYHNHSSQTFHPNLLSQSLVKPFIPTFHSNLSSQTFI